MNHDVSILIVDDDESSSKSLALILKKKGYKVDLAETGQKAIEKVKERSFNVALLDIRLPDMEGTLLLPMLKDTRPEMDAIMVTGHASVENAVQAINKGASGYVTKPIIIDELMLQLRELVEKQDLREEKRKTEEQLKESLKEKEVLLKEIHHRVKNNMQIIYGMLNLQLAKIKDAAVAEKLRGTQHRIKSMALVHERLYSSKNLSMIEFRDYVQKLLLHLFHSYGGDSNKIHQKIDIENIFLDISIAIPCGLIVSELVSNSLRHGFPDGKGKNKKRDSEKEIYVKLSLDKKNKYTLTVRDNGIGFPRDLDFRRTDSLGLQIVNTLVEQLEGKIRLQKKEGTVFQIEFSS
jgi:two-component sensor histidine kinase